MVIIVELLALLLVALLGFVYYLVQVNKRQKKMIKGKANKTSEEEKRHRANIEKAFRYAKKNISDVNSPMFEKTFIAIYEDIKQEEEAKKRLESEVIE